MTERINISAPNINTDQALIYIKEALETGQIAQGPGVLLGEKAVSAALGSKFTALYANGTASLRGSIVSAVASKNGGPTHVDRFITDKEIIIPAFSFNATINTVLDSGANARVVDIREDDFELDPELAAQAINDKTVGIVPVDLYGQASSVNRNDKRFDSLAMIRDAAQAHGALINGQPLTKHGDAVSLSFYPTKNIAAPEGGAILTDYEDIDRIAPRIYRNQGMSAPYVYEMTGDNLRMTDIHAAILRANIGSLAYVNARRAENAALLSEGLKDIEGLVVPQVKDGYEHVWHQYTIRVENDFGMNRDDLRTRLDEKGIGSGIYYPKTMIDHPTFENHPRIKFDDLSVAQKVANEVLSLPVHPNVTPNDIDRIVATVKKIQKGKA